MASDLHKRPAQPRMPRDAGDATVFYERDLHYPKNREIVARSRVIPAVTASEGPGVHMKMGGAFVVLTASETMGLITRLQCALSTARTITESGRGLYTRVANVASVASADTEEMQDES